ncbi:carboxymuconolactone decarboxylase family protein [Streptomyces sp. NPDC046985]|uniref:carboxymuconolactone decarboxylase family protein n=1 Tax=Streptomyces sp. NPDC046985 TaxID=3155377 RepID=UPI0033DB7471
MLLRPAVRHSLARLRHIRAVPPPRAGGPAAAVFQEVRRDFGLLAPPVVLHAPQPPVLAAAWTMLRETLVATGSAPREQKEAVAAAVSFANACPYCVEVHGATLLGMRGGRDAAAISRGRFEAVTDPALRSAALWAAGRAGPDGLDGGADRGPHESAELTGVAVTFHYLNRVVNVFLDSSPIPPRTPAAVRATALRLLGRALGESARAHREPGRSLDLLPAAALPDDLGWARAVPTVAGAFARAAAAIGEAGERVVPAPVRALLEKELADWDGRAPGLDGARRIEDAVAGLPRVERAAARVALSTALASYRVEESSVAPLRAAGFGDGDMVALIAWSAFTAARRAGTLLARGAGTVSAPAPAPGSRSGPAPTLGSMPAPGLGSAPAPRSTPAPAPRSTPAPGSRSGSAPAPGSGSTPGSTPRPGSGSAPSPGSTPRSASAPAPGSRSRSGSTPAPALGSGSAPTPGSTPRPGSGSAPSPGSASAPAPGSRSGSGSGSTPNSGSASDDRRGR